MSKLLKLEPYPVIAWTGGTAPKPLLGISKKERGLVSYLFQEQVMIWLDYWKVKVPLDVCRIFWNRARHDAHSTFRDCA